jgi:hypothetical protein
MNFEHQQQCLGNNQLTYFPYSYQFHNNESFKKRISIDYLSGQVGEIQLETSFDPGFDELINGSVKVSFRVLTERSKYVEGFLNTYSL